MDGFKHSDGRKAQNIALRGGRLIRLVNEETALPEGDVESRIKRRNEAIENAEKELKKAPAGRQRGVSGYGKSGKQTEKELEEAFK